MKERGKAIIVGYDFSDFSNHALNHALFYSFQTNMKVCLVHVAKHESQVEEMEVKLKNEADRVYHETGKQVNIQVRVGKVASGLRAAAIEISATIIFIGTHGVKGIQKLVGSNALKIILDSVIPFVIVQKPLKLGDGFSVVCPIDSRKESKEVLFWVKYLAKTLDAHVYLVYPNYKTQARISMTKANVNFSRHYLRDFHVSFEENGLNSRHFNDAVVEFSKMKNADLILSITGRQTRVQNFFSASKIQYLIANREKIPVLCLSPRKDLWTYGSYK